MHRHGAVAHLARTGHGGRLGGCSAADIERFAEEEGEVPLVLAARLLSGALEHMSVLLEVIDDGMVHDTE